MLPLWMALRIFIFFLIGSILARADEKQSRRVQGGDLLYLGKGVAATPEKAQLFAEVEAIKGIASECGVLDAVIYDKKVGVAPQGYVAVVEAGISFEDCESGKRTSPEQKKRRANPMLAKDLEIYFKLLGEPDQSQESDDLREYLEQEFGGLHDSIDGVSHRIDRLEDRLGGRSASVQTTAPITASQSPRGDQSVCRDRYRMLMTEANAEALSNTPPGNLSQGRAAILMNQAQAVLAGCQ